jgi:hypothetical protein
MFDMNEQQGQFLKDEFLTLTLMATVQRAKVYAPGATDRAKDRFRNGFRKSLDQLESAYREHVPEESHVRNIESAF